MKQVVVKENHVTQVVLKENQREEATRVMIRHQENHVIQVLVKENREATRLIRHQEEKIEKKDTGKIIMIYF